MASGFEVAAHRSVEFLDRIRTEHGVALSELNLGGGLGIRYTDDDEPPLIEDIALTWSGSWCGSAASSTFRCRGSPSNRVAL